MGPPGAGKGTQAQVIAKKLGIAHISTGELFRGHIKNQTELGKLAKTFIDKGELVPDEVTLNMFKVRIAESDCANGFMLDGFPRTVPQADALKDIAEIDKAISIVLEDEEVVKRLTGRRTCECGAFYNVNISFLMPQVDNTCDKCGKTLIQRDDDQEITIRNRLVVYRRQTGPLLDYYKDILFDVNGVGSVEEVTERIMEGL